METEDDRVRQRRLAQHAQTLRTRIRELSQRAYWDQFERTPELVIMFVPIEASLGAAFRHDPELFEYAMRHKVIVSSPVVLFAVLKAIAYGWQQQKLAENAADIAAHGNRVYERIVKFVSHLAGVGKSLENCVATYNEAIGSFEGRLLPAARRFREMGVGLRDLESPERLDAHPRSVPAEQQRKPQAKPGEGGSDSP